MAPGRIVTGGEDLLAGAQAHPAALSPTLSQPVEGESAMGSSVPSLVEGIAPNSNGSGTESPSKVPGSPLDGFVTPASNEPLNGRAKPFNADLPIAIIGIAVRAGAASTPDEFFEMLSRGRSAFSPEVPPERFNNASFYHPNPGKLGCINTNGASFIQQDITKFDAPFFNITELEATSLDPQQRILLECAFEALDNAGIQKHATIGKDIGVFIGAGTPEYEYDLFRDSDSMPMFQATGTLACALVTLRAFLTFLRESNRHAVQ
jgi:hypothetical protein